MLEELINNIDKIHTTPMGLQRIQKNLGLGDTDIILWCKNAILHADRISKNGKNYYAYFKGSVITVNAKSYTIITAHRVRPQIEHLREDKYSYLENYLYYAIYVPKGDEAPPRDIIYQKDLYAYIKDFGTHPADLGVVALQNKMVVGMAWTRAMSGYGTIDNETPELAISIDPIFRNLGIGRKLMRELFKLLVEHGYKKISLSVQRENRAVGFYQSLGFEIANAKDSTYLMIKKL